VREAAQANPRCHAFAMAGAFGWGTLAASSLLIGGVLAITVDLKDRALGLVMAFGSGVLISAVAYELVQEAFEKAAGAGAIGLGFFAGALTFYAGDVLIDRMGGKGRKSMAGDAQASGSGLAIVLGIVLDGIPESIVIGVTLLDGNGVGLAVLAAVFLSNLPEAAAATTGLRTSGWTTARVMGLWAFVVLVSGLSSLAGYGLFDGASPEALAFILAYAGGAILTMLADTLMPEAFEKGGAQAGLLTSVGFALAFALTTLE
jgi:ZIP family zinc transporter